MRTPREHTVDRAIVRVLMNVGDYLHPQESLFDEVQMLLAQAPTQSEFVAGLNHLESRQLVIRVLGERDYKCRLTDAGRAWAAENRVR